MSARDRTAATQVGQPAQADRPAEPEQERFNFGPFTFDVTLAKHILATEGPQEVRVVETERLVSPFIGIWPDQAAALPDAALDEPLIAVQRRNPDADPDSPLRMLVIDGYHRIHAADTRGRPTLTLHILSPEQSARVEGEPRW